jgi:uncharacterized protein
MVKNNDLLDINKILSILESQKDKLSYFGVKEIGIFGSYARGDQTPQSDIDIIVKFNDGKKSFKSFMKLSFFLQELFHKKVDLLTEKSISPFIKPYIDKEVVFEKIS